MSRDDRTARQEELSPNGRGDAPRMQSLTFPPLRQKTARREKRRPGPANKPHDYRPRLEDLRGTPAGVTPTTSGGTPDEPRKPLPYVRLHLPDARSRGADAGGRQ
ncbi:hypothetical protein GCM10020220_020590 [Nonomuraea rubra]